MIIGESWEAFKEKMIGPGASNNQIENMKAAYYFGMLALMIIMNNVSTEEQLTEIQKEMDEYLENYYEP